MQQIRISAESTSDIGEQIRAIRLPDGAAARVVVFDKWGRQQGLLTLECFGSSDPKPGSETDSGPSSFPHEGERYYVATGNIARPGSDRDGIPFSLEYTETQGPKIGQSFEPDAPVTVGEFYSAGATWTKVTAPPIRNLSDREVASLSVGKSLAKRAYEAYKAWDPENVYELKARRVKKGGAA